MKQLKLILSLLRDKRVHPLIKAIPFLALGYVILYPDLLPGPIDDTGVLIFLWQIFLALVPDEIIDEYKLDQSIQESSAVDQDNIIEGEFWEE